MAIVDFFALVYLNHILNTLIYSRMNFKTVTMVKSKLAKAIEPRLLSERRMLRMIGKEGYPDSKYHIATVELVQ